MSKLPTNVSEYLKRCGLSDRELARCTLSTRMYHDLGLYGDIAEAYMSVLVDHYNVDMNDFEFEKFFPPEFSGRNMFTRMLIWIIPFAGRAARNRDEYLPLTLDMIDRSMHTKRWSPAA